MNCRRLESLAADWAASRLSKEEAASAERHCARCAACARLLEVETRLRQAWNAMEETGTRSVDVWPRLSRRLEPRRRISPVPRLVWSGAAAIAVIAAIGLRAPAPAPGPPVLAGAELASRPSEGHWAPPASSVAAWANMNEETAPNPAVDDPAGGAMEEIWTHINTERH